MTKSVVEQLEELETAFGQTAQSVSRSEWSAMRGSGAIVKVKINRWRARMKLDWAELGLGVSETFARAQGESKPPFTLGSKYLFDVEYLKRLNKIETQARQAIKRRALKTEFGMFVPATAYNALNADLQALRAQYDAEREYLVENYEELRESTERMWQPWLTDAWTTYYNNGGRLEAQEYLDLFWGEIESHIKSLEEMVELMSFDVQLSFMPSVDGAAQGDVGLSEDAVAMQQDIIRSMRESKQARVDSFLQDVQREIYGRISQVALDVQDSIAKGGKVTKRNVNSLKAMVESLQELNFTDDARVDAVIATMRESFDFDAGEARIAEGDVGELLNGVMAQAEIAIVQAKDLTVDFGHGAGIDLTQGAGELDLGNGSDELTLEDNQGSLF